MQILHTVIAVIMLIMAAYFTFNFTMCCFMKRATIQDVVKSAITAAGLALAALYVLHW